MDGTKTSTQSPAVATRRSYLRPHLSWGLIRYLTLEVLKVFAFVLALLEFGYALLVAVVVARRFDLDLLLVLPAFWKTSLGMLNDSVPLALLFAVGIVYGRLVADREFAALKSFGLSHAHLLMPLVLIGLFSGICGFFINGFLAPEMNYQKRNYGALLAMQLRYLGEGWNRDFPFGKQNLWVLHYDGARVEGIFLSPRGKDKVKEIIPEEIAEQIDPVAEAFYIFAKRGVVLTPEEVRAEQEAAGGEAAGRPETFKFRLYDVTLFVSDQVFSDEPSAYMHRFDFDRLDFPYAPSNLEDIRQAKHLLFPELYREMVESRADSESAWTDSGAQADVQKRYRELSTEYWWRWARIFSFFLFPLFPGVVALLLGAENRYLPFFISSLIAPSVFYGMAAIGQMLGQSGVVPWLAMNLGNFLLVLILLGGYLTLDSRLLRRVNG